MSASPTQLDEIHRQVREFFASHPVISVRPTNGDPPDQYEITYTITGMCKTGEEQIVKSVNHIVELAIPFGFPHFPPSCKPKNDIFHPDFDPAAICLGDFWEQDRPLSDLIIHIGQLINGEIYSTTNAFNEDAAQWYQENSSKFPLTNVQWIPEKVSTSSTRDRIHEIDTLDETDLTTDFDFLALEDEGDGPDNIPDTNTPEVVDSSPAIDFEILSLLESQKKYYTLLKEGEKTPHPSEELSELCEHAREQIRQAERLHRGGKKFEDKGEAQIAHEKYQQITSFVSDFPTIDSDIQRIKQTLDFMADINPNIAGDFSAPHVAVESTAPESKVPKTKDKDTSENARKVTATKSPTPHELFLPKKPEKNKLSLFLFLGLLAMGIGSIVFFWYSSAATLSNAESAYDQCSRSRANNQFATAKGLCDQALQLVDDVKFIHRERADQLEKSILSILQSETLTQGLAGNILLGANYIPREEVKALQSLQDKLKEAEKLFEEERWQSALTLYNTLLPAAESNPYLDSQIIEDMKRKLQLSEFRMSYDPAQVSIQKGQWEDAIERLLQAQKILVTLSESDRGRYSQQLQSALQKSQFANLKEQGDLSFTGSDWKSALESYNLALASGQVTALPPESIAAIRNNIKRAELYTTINIGNKAFASGSWDDAIEAYGKASDLLMSIQGVTSETDSDMNIRKLARIILQATIIRDRQTVQTLLENNDLVNAKRTYVEIKKTIASSSFGAEEEFSKIAAEINTAIQSLDKELYLMEKVEYLKANYQSIFSTHYPDSSPEKLTNPVIKNTQQTESQLVFRMQCTETGGGRPLTLVMHYAYDIHSGKWRLFSGN